jgi:hypothetical protein
MPHAVRRRIEYFASQFEFCDQAAEQFEYKTKDTVKLSGLDVGLVVGEESGIDKIKDLGSQTKNGLSVRSLTTLILFSKALAYFHGEAEVTLECVRQILPFVLHDKLTPNLESPFFDQVGKRVLRVDRIGWLRNLFDLSCAEFDRLDLDRTDPVSELSAGIEEGLDGVSQHDAEQALQRIEQVLAEWSNGRKVYGHVHDDILKLKYLHQRYSNYLRWLKWT